MLRPEADSILNLVTGGDPLFIDGVSTVEINRHRFDGLSEKLGVSPDDVVVDVGSFPGFGLKFFENYIASGVLPNDYVERLNRLGVDSVPWDVELEHVSVDGDVFLFQEVVEHLRRPMVGLKNIVDSMPQGARIYISTNNAFYYGYILKMIFMRPIMDPLETEFTCYPGHHRYYSVRELSSALGGLGLKVLHSGNVNFLPPIRFYRRKSLGLLKWILAKILPAGYSTHIELIAVKQ